MTNFYNQIAIYNFKNINYAFFRKEVYMMNFFDNLGNIVTAIANAVVNAFNLVSGIFYKTGEGGGIQFLGYIALGGLAISAVGLGIRTILKLINRKM